MRLLARVLGALLVLLALASWLLPSYVDRRSNTVDRTPLSEPSPEARALHEELLIVDLHDDILLWGRDPLKRSSVGQTDVPRLLEGGVGLQLFGAPTKAPFGLNFDRNSADAFDMITLLTILQRWPPTTWWSLRARALHIADRLERAAAASDGGVVLVRDRGDLAALIAELETGRQVMGAMLALEGMHPLEGDLANVDVLFDAGYRMLAPTHFFDNDVAGSAHGEEKGGLTEFGRRAIERMQQLGMAIDIAHASPATVNDILAIARGPIFVSHGGVQATCPGPRTLSDEQIDAIAAGGGLIGIGFFEGAVCDISPAGIVRGIRYVADRVGVAHVALGSDWDGGTHVVVDAPRVVHLTDALLQDGFTRREIEAIMGRNALRVIGEVLPQKGAAQPGEGHL